MSDRIGRLQQAFEALAGGDAGRFRDLFADEAQWLGVPGSGFEGDTPI